MRRAPTGLLLPLLLAAAVAAPAAEIGLLDRDGKPLPFTTEEEVLEYLRTADVVEWDEIEQGTNPRKRIVVLEKDGVRSRAIFRFGDEVKPEAPHGGFVDSYKSELAAYELNRMLGVDRVPPVVPRRLRRKSGALQIWLEGAMTDADRRKKNIEPPDPEAFDRQLQIMHLFDNLILNTDRNPGNVLIDRHWRIWLIDQTRSFAGRRDLKYPERLRGCDRELWEKLRSVSDAEIRERLRRYVRYPDSLLDRRRALVRELEARMATAGSEGVLFSTETEGSRPDP